MLEKKECSDKTDAEIVQLTLIEPEYYGCIMDRYKDKLLRFIIRRSGVPFDDAKDILQGVFLKAYQNLNDFDTDLSFSAWIYRIAFHETVSDFRRRKARPQSVSLEETGLGEILHEVDVGFDLDRKDADAAVRRIVDELGEGERDAMILRFFEEKGYREIADILEKPEGTVATLLSRAKKKVREELIELRRHEHGKGH